MKKAVPLFLLALAGCGTMNDVWGHAPLDGPAPHVYGGLRNDLYYANAKGCEGMAGLIFIPDLPFSAVLDTLLLPITGPWVVIPAPARGAASTAVWEMRCPLRGYIVAGIDARVSDRAIDVSIRGENGAPVSPGVTTGRAVVFTALYAGGAPRPTSC